MRFFVIFISLAIPLVGGILLLDAPWNVDAAEIWRRKAVACAAALGASVALAVVGGMVGPWLSRLQGWIDWKAGVRRFPPS